MTGLFTSSVIPLIGIGSVFVILTAVEFTAGKSGTVFEEGALKSSRKRLAAMIIGIAAVLGLVLAFQGIWLRDKAIAYTDCFYRLYITSGPSPVNYDSLWKIYAVTAARSAGRNHFSLSEANSRTSLKSLTRLALSRDFANIDKFFIE